MIVEYTNDLLRLSTWHDEWRVFSSALGLPPGEHDHWNWQGKAAHIGQSIDFLIAAFCDEGDSRCHGLIKVVWPKPSRLAHGRDALCLDYIESAPWNRYDYPYGREHTNMGRLMMHHVVMISDELGFEGRVCLVSLPQSEEFYSKLGFSDVGYGEGNDSYLSAFELGAVNAQQLINDFTA